MCQSGKFTVYFSFVSEIGGDHIARESASPLREIGGADYVRDSPLTGRVRVTRSSSEVARPHTRSTGSVTGSVTKASRSRRSPRGGRRPIRISILRRFRGPSHRLLNNVAQGRLFVNPMRLYTNPTVQGQPYITLPVLQLRLQKSFINNATK